MVVKEEQPISLFSRRFLLRQVFSAAEGRGSALVYGAISFAVSALFAGTHALFGAYPFALGYVAVCRHRYPFALGGALVGSLALGERGVVYSLAYLLLTALRLLFSHPRGEGQLLPASAAYFEEEPPLRVASACVSGFFLAIYQLIAGGLSTASFLFALAMIALPTLSSFAYLSFFEDGRTLSALLLEEPKKEPSRADFSLSLSLCALFFTIALSLLPFSVLGVSLSLLFVAALALLLPLRFGVLRGGLTVIVAALGTLALPYLPAFAVMAVAVGLLSSLMPLYALALGVAAALAVAYAIVGTDMVISFLPEVIVAASLCLPLCRYLPKLAASVREGGTQSREDLQDTARRPSALRRIEMLSGAYRSLSQVFGRLSENAARPTEGEYREACLAAFAHHCEACAGQAGCWREGQQNARRAANCLAEQYAGGTPPPEISLPDSMMRSCGSLSHIRRDVAEACAALEEGKRRGEKNALFAENYRMTADMLADAARREAREEREDSTLSRAARVVFSELGIPVRRVQVLGERHRTVLATGMAKETPERERELCLRLSALCDCRFGEPTYLLRGGKATMRLESLPRYAVSSHGAGAAKGREVSGDAFSTFVGEGDYFYALLADGMGSGREAAITSGICGAFLHQTLAAGASKGVALRALNTVLAERGCECSSTIDLFELDLLFGRASFIKSGAAASYVKRGDSLFRIRSATVPIGILDALDAERIRFDVQAGDVVVMLSDGVSQSPEDSIWLVEMLSGAWESDLDLMAEKILEGARTHADRGDDMTVELLAISEAKSA